MKGLREIPGIVDVLQDWENRVIRVSVKVDQARARLVGITSRDVANSLNSMISGGEVTQYREGDEEIPVILRGTEAERTNVAAIRGLNVFSKKLGTAVPLEQIADIQGGWDFYRIKRRGQQRTMTISAKHPNLKADQIYTTLKPAIDSLDLPEGYSWELGGELEQSKKAQAYLFASTPD